MDILISSNLERLIYHSAGNDAAKNAERMENLKKDGVYTVTEQMKKEMADFVPGFATEADTAAEIKELYERTGYVIDTHTAVASAVYRRYRKESGDTVPAVIVSTASPFKFARSVMEAINGKKDDREDFAVIDDLSKTANVAEPPAIREIRTAPVKHDTVCEIAGMEQEVRRVLKIGKAEV